MFSRHKRPYHELHIITSTYSNPHVRIPLTLLAQSDILMWRSLALLLVARPALLSDHKVCSTTLTLHCQQRGTPAEHNGIHAIIFELLLCWRLGITKFHYNLHGDSMSSLAWVKANRVNSSLARRENIVFTTLSMHLDANVAVTTHIPGILIVVFDGLSRNVSPATQRLQRIQRCQQRIDVIYPPFVWPWWSYRWYHRTHKFITKILARIVTSCLCTYR